MFYQVKILLFSTIGTREKNVIWKNVVSRVLNTKKYSDEKRVLRKKRNNKKNVSNNVISRVNCSFFYHAFFISG